MRIPRIALLVALIGLAFPMGRIATHMGAWDPVARMRLHLERRQH